MTRCGHPSWSRTVAAWFSDVVSMAPSPSDGVRLPGQEALDKASYVGLYRTCRAGALAPRQLLKNHTASPREGPFWAGVWPKPCLLLPSCAPRNPSPRRRCCAQSPPDVREKIG